MKKEFGNYQNQQVSSFTLENDKIKLEILDLGARVNSCIVKDVDLDVVQGFDSCESLMNSEPYMGATVGRVCNRIGKGKFCLNDKEYQLAINNNGNTLHGGIEGFHSKVFNVIEEENKLVCSYVSPNMEEGFPGELNLVVTYELLEDGYSFDVEATSSEDTCCSITNHAYFNLNGYQSETALDHQVLIYADEYSHVDADGLTSDVNENVVGTPFDFTKETVIETQIKKDFEQLKLGNGFDHNFIIKGEGLRICAKALAEKCQMKVYTTMPCMHFYTANFLDTTCGKNNTAFKPRSSFCFETQYYPNSINYDNATKPILKKGEVMKHTTQYHFNKIKGEE